MRRLELFLLFPQPRQACLGLANLGVNLFLVVAGKLSLFNLGAFGPRSASNIQKWQTGDLANFRGGEHTAIDSHVGKVALQRLRGGAFAQSKGLAGHGRAAQRVALDVELGRPAVQVNLHSARPA